MKHLKSEMAPGIRWDDLKPEPKKTEKIGSVTLFFVVLAAIGGLIYYLTWHPKKIREFDKGGAATFITVGGSIIIVIGFFWVIVIVMWIYDLFTWKPGMTYEGKIRTNT